VTSTVDPARSYLERLSQGAPRVSRDVRPQPIPPTRTGPRLPWPSRKVAGRRTPTHRLGPKAGAWVAVVDGELEWFSNGGASP